MFCWLDGMVVKGSRKFLTEPLILKWILSFELCLLVFACYLLTGEEGRLTDVFTGQAQEQGLSRLEQ